MDDYTTLNPERKGKRIMLRFPLSVGKQWQDQFSEPVTAHLSPTASWRYDYQAKAYSTVSGAERVEVAAGTFDTLIVERVTQWTKRHPQSTSDATKALHCDDPECSVSGYSKEVIWYAPKVGRAVLRAYSQSGDGAYLMDRTPHEMLHDASAVITEMTSFGEEKTCPAPGQVKLGPGSLPRHGMGSRYG